MNKVEKIEQSLKEITDLNTTIGSHLLVQTLMGQEIDKDEMEMHAITKQIHEQLSDYKTIIENNFQPTSYFDNIEISRQLWAEITRNNFTKTTFGIESLIQEQTLSATIHADIRRYQKLIKERENNA